MDSGKQLKSKIPSIVVKTHTWLKDSHSLFDYESNKVQNINFNIPVIEKKPISLYRKRQGDHRIIMEDNPNNVDRD